ncbi:hypothetical protein AK812_SmicGene23143 [Symbiodinium microadriaticum]|uniref:Uncharacterized protein n=1 Tax=Symbiodinium microadriaticum TaxID=2951 RepID=A0A1Q9DHZ6_SYMMI|nr:hypothetical protein AK812_SmicGene23143 [Symbiodinium microadriaticum]
MSGQEWAELCQLDEEQFEARFERWQRVLGGSDEDPLLHPASVAIPHALLVATVFQQRDWGRDPGVFVEGAQGAVLAARVMDFSDDGPAEEGPFPDRMLTELMLDNTAAISFIGGAGNQRTRHLKVRGFKIRQLVQSGWTVTHCRGEVQKADLMTKVLSAARTRFLCDLLQLGAEVTTPEPETQEESVAYSVPASCLQGLLLLLQASNCVGTSSEDSETGVAIEWPWELGIATLLVVLSTLFIWEASGAPCRKRAEPRPTVRAVNAHKKDRRSRRLQEQVAAAIDSAVSESPTGDEARSQVRRSRNKCTVDFADEGAMLRAYLRVPKQRGDQVGTASHDQISRLSCLPSLPSETVYPIHVAARLADVEAMFVNGCPSLTDIMRNWANLKFVYEVT